MSSISAGTTSTTTLIHSGDTTGSLVFKTNDTGSGGTTAVTIDTSQNVGIGTSSPTNKLEIVSATNPTIRITDTTNNCYTEINATDNGGYVGTASNHWFAFTTNNTERMRIDSSGNLLVGTTSLSGGKINAVNASGLWVLKIQDAASNGAMIQFITPGGAQAGSITISGSTTTYGSGSDYRLKEQIKPLENALFKVSQLKPVSWVWKAEQTSGQGFIAHELAEIVPDCVVGEKDAVDENGHIKPQMVDTSFLVATLTAALQEQQALIQQLQADVAVLKGTQP